MPVDYACNFRYRVFCFPDLELLHNAELKLPDTYHGSGMAKYCYDISRMIARLYFCKHVQILHVEIVSAWALEGDVHAVVHVLRTIEYPGEVHLNAIGLVTPTPRFKDKFIELGKLIGA
jgi:hypothetical protein